MSEPDYNSLRLQNQLCFPLYLCSKELIKKYGPLLKKLDLTYTQYAVMLYLWEHQSGSVTDLCRVLLLNTNTLSPLLQKLEQKGYIEHKRDKKDGRGVKIQLTKRGFDLRDEALSVPCAMQKCISLSDEDVETLYRLLYKVLFNIEGANHENN